MGPLHRCARYPGLAVIVAVLALVAFGWGAALGAGGPIILPFDSGDAQWTCAEAGRFAVVPGESYGRSAQVAEVRFEREREIAIRWKGILDLSQCAALRFDVFVPRLPAHVSMAAFFVDEDGFWYQTWRPIVPARDRWSTHEVDLRPAAGQIESRGHGRPWGPYVARRVEVGLAIFTDFPATGAIALDRVVLLPAEPEDATCPQEVWNVETTPGRIPRYGKFEITFETSRCYENPYDPDEVEVWGLFTAPNGEEIRVPGFFYQGYARLLDGKVERLVPVGAPKWKIRFAPRQVGRYSYRIEVSDRAGRVVTDPFVLECVASENPGCVVVCEGDRAYFEFEDGSFYYPIGENIPATFNAKGSAELGVSINMFEGTFAYDRYLDGMARSGQNYARIWLASWSFGLEWSRAYHPAYRDLGRYNQENAWRLDYVMEEAARRGIHVQLALTTFGHFRESSQFEGDWGWSPYNVRNGGPLRHPQEFWSDETAQRMYQRMVRYAAARWGYASNLLAWEIMNEVDLVSGYPNDARRPNPAFKQRIVEWHRRCVETLRRYDPNPHMVTTNFAIWTNDPDLVSLPEISYTSTNHYNVQIVRVMRENIFPLKRSFGKPALMTEAGYDFKGAMPETTERYLHLCLWGSYMIPFAGAAVSWWWDFIDARNLYAVFRPLAEFARGEDRRGRNLEMAEGLLKDAEGRPLRELCADVLRNDRSGYFWIYERRLFRAESDPVFSPEPREGLSLEIPGMVDGAYRVEFWDTWAGGRLAETTASAVNGVLACPVPRFTGDIAGKIRFLEVAPPRSSGE